MDCRSVVRPPSFVPSFLVPVNSCSELGHKRFRTSRGVKLIFIAFFLRAKFVLERKLKGRRLVD